MEIGFLGKAYRGRRVLVTGHTGFKGSWLSLWLSHLEADTAGLALAPEEGAHFSSLCLQMRSVIGDIRDMDALAGVFAAARPEIVFHLAAQPLVRRSYRQPVDTFDVNVMGTVNVLEACRACPDVRAVVVVTSDKCYANNEWVWGYRENDRLGGKDPYSASKACAELVAASYRDAFFHSGGPLLATVRGGNVIGGGDWSEDRLIPDLVRAVGAGASLEVRNPLARRPWQHVLDCLGGYLCLGAKLLDERKDFAQAWNFGPDAAKAVTVGELLDRIASIWPAVRWHVAESPELREAQALSIDSAKARALLKWEPVWSLETALARTGQWYKAFMEDNRVESHAQLDAYLADAGGR
ncbi:CDP-glucose 4,6-dehydratase [Fundidesulfovibrio soli]|uniref:CDP-glucose 4,6-dehydratase n=1 Tax=Fundidesulfovibrio soli TaxID=2922716 RepID=UPI001FAEFD2E|nr:CDP-glucose 4,6-dehydratase [Fundidesulfovibrio soli]